MKEESRIEALEHELKILKNEIQSTLLEIREQILNHYYPELRAEEPLHHHSLPVRPAVGRPGVPTKSAPVTAEEPISLSEITAKGQIQPFSDIFLEDLDMDDADTDDNAQGHSNTLVNSRRPAPNAFDDLDDLDMSDAEDADADQADNHVVVREWKTQQVASGAKPAAAVPTTREVNFRQLKQGNGTQVAATSAAPTVRAVSAAQVTEQTAAPTSGLPNLAALTKWANDAVVSVGKERTLEVIDTYATGGKLSGAARSALLSVVARAADVEHETTPGSRAMLALMVALDQILDE